ncbi:hypothetical protein DPMN_083365 [Dreissena polymorpha]|uniref:G-protein coupled receptors family 1 profile domain-containing protein n=2 Tax=Dreissena polymorpha TaxID=45954 RepID=A0A9D3Y9S5_DREPO|nr:hypothetical protein DPMN_083365 [Dreissena polymorpha]
MKSKALRHKSYSQYLSALAIFDTLTLLIRQIRIIDEYSSDTWESNTIFRKFDDFGCKAFNFIEHIAYLMSSWLIVMMALERLLAVWFPFKKFILRRRSGATWAIVLLFLGLSLSQVFRLVMVKKIDTVTCGAIDSFWELYVNLHMYFYNMSLTFILPVGFVLVCNGMVLYQIFKVRREILQQDKDKRSRFNRPIRKSHRTTSMLLIVSFTFLGTLLPLLTMSLVFDLVLKSRGRKDAFSLYLAITPYMEVAAVLSLVNYAANFYIYILSGKNFRFELRKVFNRQRTTSRSFTYKSSKETREEVIRLW